MSLARKSLSVFTRDVLLLLTNIGTSVLIARLLGPHALGLWVILALIPSYSEMFARIKVDAAAVYLLGRKEYSMEQIVPALHIIAVVTSCLVLIPATIFFNEIGARIFSDDFHKVDNMVVIMLLQIPINFLYLNYMYLHIFREDVTSVNLMVITRALLGAGLIIVALLGFELGLFAVVFGSTAGLLAALLIGFFRLGSIRLDWSGLNLKMFRRLLGYGGQLYIGVAVTNLSTYSTQAIIVAICAPVLIAYYSLAQQLAQMLNKITDAMGTFLFPRLAKGESKQDSAELAALAFRVSFAILAPVAIFAGITIKPAVMLLYGFEYAPLIPVFYMLLPAVLCLAAGSTLMIYFQGVGRADLVVKLSFLPMVFQVSLSLILVPDWQIKGGALAFLISAILALGLQVATFLYVTRKKFKRDLLVRRSDLQLVLGFVSTIISFPKRKEIS